FPLRSPSTLLQYNTQRTLSLSPSPTLLLPECRMPTGLPLDLDNLLDPVAGADQAGSSATFLELRSQLDDLRREVRPEDFEADDPRRPDKPQYADWVKVEDV